MTNQIKILTDHARWLKDCQRDADVQDAIAWAVERLRQNLCNNTTDVQELIVELKDCHERNKQVAHFNGADFPRNSVWLRAASALQAQADALNRKTCEALNTQRAQEERIAELEAVNTRLRKEIEEAPHNILCPIWVNGYKANLIEWEDDCGDKYVCNCWKSKAMKEEK